jgi:ribonuclease HI
MAAEYHYPPLSCNGQEGIAWCNAVVAGAFYSWPKQERKVVNIKRVIIYADGASRGNPGPAAIGVTIKDKRGKLITLISQRIGRATNNQAEYKAIIVALEHAITLGANQVEIHSDSELVVRQINGEYRVKKATLKPLYQQVKRLQSQLKSFTITHIPRQQNIEADNLANNALNGYS